MMTTLHEITSALDNLLQPHLFNDYCPNGLQVNGTQPIKTIITGVTACQALLDQAVKHQANAILVHHGYFWRGESPTLQGMKYHRIKTLLQHDIALLAYHLPLDAHVEHGNNVQLAKQLNITVEGTLNSIDPAIVFHGHLTNPMSGSDFAKHIHQCLQRQPLHIDAPNLKIQRIVWCSGGAQDYIDAAIDAGADAYLTGEVSERTVHAAKEAGIHFFAAGHHATERYGVQAVGEWLQQKFLINHQFIDIDNPV